jgi:hypothetical protein
MARGSRLVPFQPLRRHLGHRNAPEAIVLVERVDLHADRFVDIGFPEPAHGHVHRALHNRAGG